MPGIFDITDKTYIRPADCIDESVTDQIFQKYSGVFSGQEWFIPHELKSTNLLVSLWKFDDSNPAAYYKIEQIDYEHMVVKWTMPVEGRAVLYSVRNFVGVSMVHEQEVGDDVWTIVHNFGTDIILFTVWVDGKAVMPAETRVVDKNTLEMAFTAPVKGKAVLMVTDPAISKGITVSWNQLVDVPDAFPPAPHKHTKDDIEGLSTDQLGEYTADDFLLKTDVGVAVPPLAPESASDPQPRIPVEFMPTVLKYRFFDNEGEQLARRLGVNSTPPHPLYLQKVPGREEAILDMYPVVRKVALMGNIDKNLSLPEQSVEASSDFLLRIQFADGLKGEAVDRNTLKITSLAGLAQVYRRPILKDGDEWTIMDSIVHRMGEYSLNLYEIFAGQNVFDGESSHIVGQDDINQPFHVLGDDMMVIDDNDIKCKILHDDHHFVYGDEEQYKGGVPMIAPTRVDAVYWDTSMRLYIIRSKESTYYTFRTFNPLTLEVRPFASAEYTEIPAHTAFCEGHIYALIQAANGTLELHEDDTDNIPFFTWEKLAEFPAEPFPPLEGDGRLLFRVNGDVLVILNTSLNSLATYSLAGGVKLSEIPLPKVGKDFDLWHDSYVSIAFEGEPQLFVSTNPVNHASGYKFRRSIDTSMGDSNFFALRDPGKGALGIKPHNVVWHSEISSDVPVTLYAHGETTLWLKSSFAWHISPFWSRVLSMDWEDYDLDAYDEIRIGFYPGVHASMPDTLYRWEAGGFKPFPSKDLALLGQPISEVKNLTLEGDTDFSYAIWLKKSKGNIRKRGHIVQNFVCRYQTADFMYPVPMAGPDIPNTVLVKCAPRTINIKNTLGRDLHGLKLVVVPVAR